MDTKETADADISENPVGCLVHRIADRWALHIVDQLEGGAMRFTALRRESPGVSQKMLTQTLRSLERDGLVKRMVFAQVPPRVEYSLTPLGRTLCEPVSAMRRWAETNHPEIVAARAAYDAKAKEEKEVGE
jgi:DNA-binding HxlR family transcriptional regulator